MVGVIELKHQPRVKAGGISGRISQVCLLEGGLGSPQQIAMRGFIRNRGLVVDLVAQGGENDTTQMDGCGSGFRQERMKGVFIFPAAVRARSIRDLGCIENIRKSHPDDQAVSGGARTRTY